MRDTIPWPINEKLIYLPELQQFVWHSFRVLLGKQRSPRAQRANCRDYTGKKDCS